MVYIQTKGRDVYRGIYGFDMRLRPTYVSAERRGSRRPAGRGAVNQKGSRAEIDTENGKEEAGATTMVAKSAVARSQGRCGHTRDNTKAKPGARVKL